MMQVLELLQLAKRHVSGWSNQQEATLNDEEIKPIALTIIESRLSEDIS